jgi:NhaA family Na+:H+ antiporter
MHDFFKRASAPGIVLAVAALLGLLLANSAAAPALSAFLGAELHVGFAPVAIVRPVSLWINDGLMSVFFFLVGLEIKREIMTGTLSSRRRITLPLAAALGGMLVPAALYAAINWGNAADLRGWAIPSATDIAFALAAISLLGARVPLSARVFLTAVAVIDDLGAVLIIALFYTESVAPQMLVAALACFAAMLTLNRLAVRRIAPYVVLGLVLWVFLLESGVHPTLAGVATAFAMPLRRPPKDALLEHRLQAWVNFGVLPIFALTNAGLALGGLSRGLLSHSILLGVGLGLALGKPMGVLLGSGLALRLRLAERPLDMSRRMLLGLACYCGIGFTMSLFIGSLAFRANPDTMKLVKLGVVFGSAAAALAGYLVLRSSPVPARRAPLPRSSPRV